MSADDLPCGCRGRNRCSYHEGQADLSAGTFASPESVRATLHVVKPDPIVDMIALMANFRPPPGLTDGDVARACIASRSYGVKEGAADKQARIVALVLAEYRRVEAHRCPDYEACLDCERCKALDYVLRAIEAGDCDEKKEK